MELGGWVETEEERRLVKELVEMRWKDRLDDRFVVLGRDRAAELFNLPRSARRSYVKWLIATLTRLGINAEIKPYYCCYDGSGRNRCTAVRVEWTPEQLELLSVALDSEPEIDPRPDSSRQSDHPILKRLNAGTEVLRQLVRHNASKVLRQIQDSALTDAQKLAAKANVRALHQNPSHHYHFARSGRVFTNHLSLQTLKNRGVGFRDSLLASPRSWRCDLQASQLATFALKAEIPELDALLDGRPVSGREYEGPWDYFVTNLDMPKARCKTLVYSVIYGMHARHLYVAYGETAMCDPLIRKMLEARKRLLAEVDPSDPKHARSALAIQAQRLERDVMRQVYDSLPEDVAVLVDMHDGLYVHMPENPKRAGEIMRDVNLWVNFYIGTLGLKTQLQWEAVPEPAHCTAV